MKPQISLETLKSGLPALTPALGEMLAEAASVCLEAQAPGIVCSIFIQQDEQSEISFLLRRLEVTDRMRRAYRDEQEATEFGACGIALLVVREITGYTVIERSVRGTGFDYWLGTAKSADLAEGDLEPFERKARLEVSGIRHGTEETIAARVREKRRQTQRSSGLYSAYVTVVEFSRPQANVKHERSLSE